MCWPTIDDGGGGGDDDKKSIGITLIDCGGIKCNYERMPIVRTSGCLSLPFTMLADVVKFLMMKMTMAQQMKEYGVYGRMEPTETNATGHNITNQKKTERIERTTDVMSAPDS